MDGIGKNERTVVMAPTMVIITFAIAEMIALMPRPIALKMEPYR
jgi:hypothetical protein